ncbi:hypothetical protein HMPREF9538_05952 [Klebsiella sp. MS 92-3]|nr:hypothetical protein HMPREF9538_05952 [Klebsiella sp. MS 92-3]
MPREKQADLRVVFNLMRFTAAKVGIKHQPFFVVVLQQHNALVGLAALIDGGDHHGRWVGKFRIAGLTQPAFKQRQGFSRKIVATQTATGVFTAQMRNLLEFVVIRHGH